MPSLNEFIEATGELPVDVNGIIVNCTVKLNAVDTEFLQTLKSVDYLTSGVKLVQKSLFNWDMTEKDNKTPLPITEENLSKMPLVFLESYLEGAKALKKQK